VALLLGVAFGTLGPSGVVAASDERWVTATADTALYSGAERSASLLGLVPGGTSYRVDGPAELEGRLWVWSPYTEGHGWIPADAVGPGRAPTREEIDAFWAGATHDDQQRLMAQLRDTDPRDYLYARYPDLAPLLDCIASRESGWANVPNRHGSGAFGPFQFMRGTFYSTTTGQNGGDWRVPADQVDAANDMVRAGRAREWQVVSRGLC
jgi:hypothetical protein